MTNAQKWQAVLNRDPRAADNFVYAVSSTRVFCRATCPAKRPRAENVAFFDTPAQAKDAGFRACKRCRPEAKRAAPALALARDVGEAQRMETLKRELRGGKTVLEAQLEAGFGSARALYERAPAQLGMTPATYKRGGVGAAIRFAFAPSEVGVVLVARTERGVCSLALGEGEAELEAGLRKEFFAAADISRDDAGLKGEMECVLASLAGDSAFPDLPLDVRATALQARVWRELQHIGRGETVSYSALAARIGQPTAVRAVASACARNPVALVHPCHRVVGKNGELSGFHWNIERKRRLLEREKGVN